MFWFLKNLEIEWKIILIAMLMLCVFAIPLQIVNLNKLKSTLDQSIDPQLESTLRLCISDGNDSTNQTISSCLERNRQWKALIPYIIEEQSYAVIVFSVMLFVLLLVFAFWSLKKLTKPLRDLAYAADCIGKGKDAVIKPGEGGALGQLERSMVTMQVELVKLREKAHAQGMENAWRDIARVMAHEIKNPLTPIQLTLDRIHDRYDNGSDLSKEEMLKFVNRIGTQVNNLERLVNDFRSFAKDAEPVFVQLQLGDAISVAAADMESSVQTTISGDASVYADKHLIQQVLLNIWKNSFEAGATSIVVTIDKTVTGVRLKIADNGSGIPAEHMERIWIPYITYKKGGSGLGLPVVKRLLESMDAEVTMESSTDTVNHGATTIITFKTILLR